MPVKLSLSVTAALFVATAALGCEAYEEVVSAVQSDDISTAERLFEEIAVDADCVDDLREWVGDYLARKTFVYAITAAPTDSKRRTALQRALGYERHWRTYNELGLMDWNGKDYDSAARNFQLAIGELVEGDPTHNAETAEIEELYELASAALALADNADIPTTRSGTPGGIFSMKIRGFEVEEVPVPITFEFDSSDFDESGKRFADALVAHVMSAKPSSVSLTGHTDPRGTDEYNLALSLDRAEAVRALLKIQGFDGDVTIEGRGESEIPAPPPGIEQDSEEHHRIARRVAFRAN